MNLRQQKLETLESRLRTVDIIERSSSNSSGWTGAAQHVTT